MSNDLFEHDFEVDLIQPENTYPMNDVQYIYINDINASNYSNGYINFTNVAVVGSSIDKQYSWSNAYVAIPYTVTLDAVDGYFTGAINDAAAGAGSISASSPENAYAVGVKGYQHFIDWTSIKFNGVACNRSSYYNNFLINEDIKTMDNNEYKLYGDILNHDFDNGAGLALNVTGGVGEVNNNTVGSSDILKNGFKPSAQVNHGHVNRMRKSNVDLTGKNYLTASGYNSSLAAFAGSGATGGNASAIQTDTYQNALVTNTTTKLVYQGVATIPLPMIHDFFKQLPSVASSTGFELRLQTNIASSNSWTVGYGAMTAINADTNLTDNTKLLDVVSLISNQTVGHTCPFMLSPAYHCAYTPGVAAPNAALAKIGPSIGTGLCVTQKTAGAGNPMSIKITSRIGWDVGQANPCRIYLPAVNYNPLYSSKILEKANYQLLYNDYYVDTVLNISGQAQVNKLFNAQLSRVRKLHILPYLSTTQNARGAINANGAVPAQLAIPNSFTSPYNSPLSSAPNTVTPLRLKNFNIQIGGSNIFMEPQAFNYQFYNNNFLSIMAHVNGNSLKSKQFGGQITKTMWEQGYNSYVINLEKVDDIIKDSLQKSFQLVFQVDGNPDLQYDFICIITYQNVLNLDRATGQITQSV
jgi:hypothetical protein